MTSSEQIKSHFSRVLKAIETLEHAYPNHEVHVVPKQQSGRRVIITHEVRLALIEEIKEKEEMLRKELDDLTKTQKYYEEQIANEEQAKSDADTKDSGNETKAEARPIPPRRPLRGSIGHVCMEALSKCPMTVSELRDHLLHLGFPFGGDEPSSHYNSIYQAMRQHRDIFVKAEGSKFTLSDAAAALIKAAHQNDEPQVTDDASGEGGPLSAFVRKDP